MDTKETIKQIVKDYIQFEPLEYEGIKNISAEKRNKSASDFGEIGKTDIEMRALVEIPETLFGMLMTRLTKEDFAWLRSKIGLQWFAKTFKAFCVAKRV